MLMYISRLISLYVENVFNLNSNSNKNRMCNGRQAENTFKTRLEYNPIYVLLSWERMKNLINKKVHLW